ncbi:hypothetical protein FFI87_032220 [Burkholderia sp. KBS0801]|nr:hypothetical protein FFI87_032220 [Burkholderia sp. KBS0801]
MRCWWLAIRSVASCSRFRAKAGGARRPIFTRQSPSEVARHRSLSEPLCVRHKLMAKEPLYATQTQGRSDD